MIASFFIIRQCPWLYTIMLWYPRT